MEFEEVDPPWATWALPMGINPSSVDPQLTQDLLTVMRYRNDRGETGSNRLTTQRIVEVIGGLPHLTEEQLDDLGHHESSCPICMNTHLASLAEEELALVMDSPAHPIETLGVTRLSRTCGHIFCRKDLLTWIRDGHPSCPLCRTAFIKPADADASAIPAQDEADSSDATDDGDFDQAMERIIAAYHEERRQMGAPPNALFGMGRPQDPEEAREEDRSEFSGMYS